MFDEFDLYNVVHKSVENDPNIKKKPISPPRKRSPVGKKSTLLTAKSLDSHFTNGKHDWCLVDCGCDLYRTLIKTANDVNEKPRLENAERVFFDLQPLSTRLALMTKFIVIAQGGTAFSPASYITVYPGSASSPTSTTSRSKSFDSSLLSPRSAASMYASPSRGVVMANSGLYVKIWANDGVKMSVFGTDPSTRLSRIQSCRLVPTAPRTIKPGRSVKISELMSNFEPRHKSDDRLNESKTIISENSHSESSLTNVGGEEGEYTSANMISNNSSNKTILTKSYSENNPRVLNTGVRIAETTTTTSSMATTTTTTTTRRKTHEEHQLPINTTTTTSTMTMTNNIDDPKTMLLPQRIQIPIRIEDPILSGTTNVLSDGTIRPAKTEVFTYSYQRKVLQPQPPSVKARTGSVEATRNNKRVEVRFDDSWEKTNEHNGGNAANQKRLLKSSEWTLTKQNSTGKKDC